MCFETGEAHGDAGATVVVANGAIIIDCGIVG